MWGDRCHKNRMLNSFGCAKRVDKNTTTLTSYNHVHKEKFCPKKSLARPFIGFQMNVEKSISK